MRRHDLDLFSLITGVLFVGLAAWHLVDTATDVDLEGGFVVPVLLVALGVVGLAGVLRSGRSPESESGEPADDDLAVSG